MAFQIMSEPIRFPIPQAWAFLLFGLLGIAWILYRQLNHKKASKSKTAPNSRQDAKHSINTYYQIEPLENLDLANEEPIKLRPFKPKFHLTMSIENSTLSDLVAMDKTYTSRIALRQKLIEEEGENVLALNAVADDAVNEFYEWMIKIYLPQRFPTVYSLTATGLYNKVTAKTLPLQPTTSKSALEILGSNVDNEFLFLLPPSTPADDGKYRLQGFVTCFPSGFATLEKLGLKLAEIHTPVPKYSEKIEKSMDRFFASLPTGKIVKRANWTITTHNRLYCLDGTHITDKERDALQEGTDFNDEEIDIDETVLRCERQTLHRLPQTQALVFSFKTYQYPIREVREEGHGEALADAIDGLGSGSVPEMKVYKKAVVWGDRIQSYLREGV